MQFKVNKYHCAACGAEASKPPCERSTTEKKPDQATLGTWSCIKCGHGVKVKRSSVAAA